jgi:hypothetical protein
MLARAEPAPGHLVFLVLPEIFSSDSCVASAGTAYTLDLKWAPLDWPTTGRTAVPISDALYFLA